MFVTWCVAQEAQLPADAQGEPRRDASRAFRESVWGLLLIVVVIGGIYTGHLHPDRGRGDERGLRVLRRPSSSTRTCTLKQVPKVLLDSANMSAMILYIITNAVLFSFLLTSEQIPQSLAGWINDMGLSPWIAS